jgi:hypothetical protein
MMESADFSDLNDSSPRTIVHRAQLGRVLLQRQMCSRAMIVLKVTFQDSTQMPFVDDDNVI